MNFTLTIALTKFSVVIASIVLKYIIVGIYLTLPKWLDKIEPHKLPGKKVTMV